MNMAARWNHTPPLVQFRQNEPQIATAPNQQCDYHQFGLLRCKRLFLSNLAEGQDHVDVKEALCLLVEKLGHGAIPSPDNGHG